MSELLKDYGNMYPKFKERSFEHPQDYFQLIQVYLYPTTLIYFMRVSGNKEGFYLDIENIDRNTIDIIIKVIKEKGEVTAEMEFVEDFDEKQEGILWEYQDKGAGKVKVPIFKDLLNEIADGIPDESECLNESI